MRVKACPFCGGEIRVDCNELDDWYLECVKPMSEDGCRMSSGLYATKEEAIAAANRRASDWISVEERLPGEHDGDYTYSKEHGEFLVDVLTYDRHGFQKVATFWRHDDGEEYFGGVSPTHWQPLLDGPEVKDG